MPIAYTASTAPKAGPRIAFAIPCVFIPKNTKPAFGSRWNGLRKFESARIANRTANVVSSGPRDGCVIRDPSLSDRNFAIACDGYPGASDIARPSALAFTQFVGFIVANRSQRPVVERTLEDRCEVKNRE